MTRQAQLGKGLLEALESVQFVVGRDGRPSGVFLDAAGWEALLDWVEDLEDRALVHGMSSRLRAGPCKSGALRWEEVAEAWRDEPA
jgi:hypothetical protein